MNLIDALATIEDLDARDRLLVGLLDGIDIFWSPGHVGDLDAFVAFATSSEFTSNLSAAVEEYKNGEVRSMAMVAEFLDGGRIILILGPESIEDIEIFLTKAKNELTPRYLH